MPSHLYGDLTQNNVILHIGRHMLRVGYGPDLTEMSRVFTGLMSEILHFCRKTDGVYVNDTKQVPGGGKELIRKLGQVSLGLTEYGFRTDTIKRLDEAERTKHGGIYSSSSVLTHTCLLNHV